MLCDHNSPIVYKDFILHKNLYSSMQGLLQKFPLVWPVVCYFWYCCMLEMRTLTNAKYRF